MKILKYLLIFFGLLITLPLVVALFVPKDYAVEREISINKPRQEVFDYIKYLKNQDHFSKWAKMDPNSRKTYSGTDGTVGFIATWDSDVKEVGKGEQEILKIDDGARIDTKLRFKKPFEAEDDAYMSTASVSDSVTMVKWGFKGAFSYPMNLMGLFINMEKEVGGDLQTGLDNLKVVLEK